KSLGVSKFSETDFRVSGHVEPRTQSLQPPKPLANAALEAPSGSTKRVSPFPRKLVPFKASTANHRLLGKRADSAHAALTNATKKTSRSKYPHCPPLPAHGHVTPLFKVRGAGRAGSVRSTMAS